MAGNSVGGQYMGIFIAAGFAICDAPIEVAGDKQIEVARHLS